MNQCDNQRPFCKKCIDSGRDCQGYERETVFIIGTVEDEGRCSSHPRRVVGKKGKASPSKPQEPKKLQLVPSQPLQPAWDDLICLSDGETVSMIGVQGSDGDRARRAVREIRACVEEHTPAA